MSRYHPYPAYRPSGIDWLGDVPEHWTVKMLRYAARFAYGDSLASEEREDGPYKVFGSNGEVGQHIAANTRAPAVVIGRKGSFGKVNYTAEPIFAIDTTYFIDCRYSSAHLRWLFYSLQSLKLDSVSKDSAVPGLSREDAYQNFVAVPNYEEQKAIADFLERETAKIDALIEKVQTGIGQLQEYRAALITAAVTGKIDVRKAVAT